MANELRTTRASIVDHVLELLDKHDKTTTAGVNCRVGHAGTYTATNVPPASRRQEHIHTLQKASADVGTLSIQYGRLCSRFTQAFMRHRD